MSDAPEVRIRRLQPPLADALEQAAAEALAEPDPAPDEEWLLPAGTHALGPAPFSLAVPGRRVRLLGSDATVIEAAGGLQLQAAAVRLESLNVDVDGDNLVLEGTAEVTLDRVVVRRGALVAVAPVLSASAVEIRDGTPAIGLDLHGDSVEVSGAVVALSPAPAGDQIGARLTATSALTITDVAVTGIEGANATGLQAAAPRLLATTVRVAQVEQPSGAPGQAVGIDLLGAELVELTDASVGGVQGSVAAGIRVVVGDEAVTAEGAFRGALLVDLSAQEISGSETAAGILVASAGPLSLRGFTIESVRGGAAQGLLALGGAGMEIGVGEVRTVLGGTGRSAGVRVLSGAAAEAVLVRDVAVEGVGRRASGEGDGTPLVPPPPVPPAAGWDAWPTAALPVVREGARALAADAAAARADGWNASPRPAAGTPGLPALPTEVEIAGLHVGAFADEPPIASGDPEAGPLKVRDAAVRRVAGTALQIVGGLRPVELLRTELWAAAAAGYLQGEEALLAALTVHRHGSGLRLGPGAVSIFNTLLSAVATGPSLPLDEGAERVTARAVFSTSVDPTEDTRFQTLAPLPYRGPGPTDLPTGMAAGEVPPETPVDLRLEPSAAVARAAVPFPSAEGGQPFVGAHEPEAAPRCEARDPEPYVPPRARRAPPPGPVVSYLARDAESLLAVMLDRARVGMPGWTDRGPADFITMLFELLSHRLDIAAYSQERAVVEGFLETATLRRAVEDHARALDYRPDPGLSATAMIRFDLVPGELSLAALTDAEGGADIPAGTLVATEASTEAAIIFATEEPLRVLPALAEMALAEAADAGETSAWLVNENGMSELGVGRWLVFVQGPHKPGHVVRITGIERGPEATRVLWDPRRPLPFSLPKRPAGDLSPGPVLGNVVPAHHGVPLAKLEPDEAEAADPLLGRWRRLLGLTVDGRLGPEVRLPVGPVSVQARGYPLPHEEAGDTRQGAPMLRVEVEGDLWERVDDLSLAGPGDEVYALRSGIDDSEVLRFGLGTSGSALPARPAHMDLEVTVGRGRIGNVGAGRLSRLIQLGSASTGDTDLEARLGLPAGPDREDRLRRVLRVGNPLPAVGGRDPEPLARIRYRAPYTVMDARSAITTADYERLLLELPEVAAARARVRSDGLRPVVQATVLLRDEDQLESAERLRRWAMVRRRMEEVRLLGFDVEVAPPRFVPLDLDLVVDAYPHADASGLQDAVAAALAGEGGLFDPDRTLLGTDVHLSALYQAVLAVPGVNAVRVNRFRRFEPEALDRLAEGVIPIGAEEVASLAPEEGLLSVTVCGGLR